MDLNYNNLTFTSESGAGMKYKVITTRKDGRFAQSYTFDTIEEAERFGFNHTACENRFGNYIPIKDERLFRVYEITKNFNIMECV